MFGDVIGTGVKTFESLAVNNIETDPVDHLNGDERILYDIVTSRNYSSVPPGVSSDEFIIKAVEAWVNDSLEREPGSYAIFVGTEDY